MLDEVDIVIIGAGPAGLGVAHALTRLGVKSFVVFDYGCEVDKRDRNNEVDIVQGVGGAGLFSDGKFSEYPSSTELWKLEHKAILSEAYKWYCDLFIKYDKKFSDFPVSFDSEVQPVDEWFLKSYESIYLDLDQRYDLIRSLQNGVKDHLRLNHSVESFEKTDCGYIVKVTTETLREKNIRCKKIVVAGGRFWTLFNTSMNNRFMRLEYGVRVEDKPERSFFVNNRMKDPKFIYGKTIDDVSRTVEYRTFCCCRHGEVVVTDNNGLRFCSGRSDCQPTDRSNFGFNVRILNKDLSNKLSKDFIYLNSLEMIPFQGIPLADAINNDALEKYYGKTGNFFLCEGLKLLLERFPDLTDATLTGPTLEGVGEYCDTDANMKVFDEDIWIVGDACGKYRGITAGMVSGYYVGSIIKK